jgi:conjugative relaxase-like TrwC/TraI family protein
MLRVTTLHAASAAATAGYYTQYLTGAPGEEPGVWVGRQAAGLGLAGEVTAEALQAVLEGRDPVTGTPLGYPLTDRVLANGTVVRAVAGFDATFSAPKSLSVWWALTGDPGLLAAHDVAVTAALEHLERFGSTTRIRADGRRLHPDSHGLSVATFRQTTSRADDPQIHTHAVISAKVQTLDGRWYALDARYLKKYQRMLGGLYQSVLRAELTHRYGIAWGPVVNGQAEIAGTPTVLLAEFSKRTAEVDQALAAKVAEFHTREGRDPTRWERAAMTREAAVDTRSHKTGNGVTDLQTRWTDEAGQLGWTSTDLVAQLDTAACQVPDAGASRVSVEDVIEQLSSGGSTWTRADVLRAICDLTPPTSGLSGERWAVVLERACDLVLEHCVDLDPVDATVRRRVSDGRSVWLEPTAARFTSEQVLAQEEHILTWALDAHDALPSPSATVEVDGLDVLQADAAAAVAGQDLLVLVVGPAGAGKTTMLQRAVDDLTAQHRPVFGLAPTAKAARVLEHETAMRCDTVAKLLHEWSRTDRPPGDEYRLPVGCTVIVDEGGMLGTGALHRLVTLADQHRWRLALVGDPYQLQAVGRGGLFHELCATGRTHELARIHRFHQPWEAAASLQLRHGDPTALDTYQAHGRIIPGDFETHVDAITSRWLDANANGDTIAITTATNDHVDSLNHAIQTARLEAGQLDGASTPIAGGEHAHPGDIVVTRRNDRRLTTTVGEPVRNRERWTVHTVHPDGSLTVSPIAEHGSVRLPADYSAEHVRLGYAATEHGNQSDTVSVGVELVTPATTRRGLYVGATRGRHENLLLVVTEQADLAEARDVLEGVLASDRADTPAITQRRQLAQHTAPDQRQPPRPPRWEVPDWFAELRADTARDLDRAEDAATAEYLERRHLDERLTIAKDARAVAERDYRPYRSAVDDATKAVDTARQHRWSAEQQLHASGLLHRRTARQALENAESELTRATTALERAQASAVSHAERHAAAHRYVEHLRDDLAYHDVFARMNDNRGTVLLLRRRLDALTGWHRWARGDDFPDEQLVALRDALSVDEGHDTSRRFVALGDALQPWVDSTGVAFPMPSQGRTDPTRRDRTIELGL